MSKFTFTIEAEKTGQGIIKVGNLEPRDYTQYEDILSKADQFDSTNVRGRLRLNDVNFYNYRKFYKQKKKEINEDSTKNAEEGFLGFAYAHQIQTVETILKLPSGGLLADQVGMGKTIEAGMLICELAYRDEWRVLVITLSNDDLIRNWHDEMFEKFGLNLAILKSDTAENVQPVFEKLRQYQSTGIVEDMQGNREEVINRVKYKYHGVLIPFAYLVNDKFIELVDKYNLENPNHPFHVDLIVVDESHRYTSSDSSKSENKLKALHHLQMKQTIEFNGEKRKQKLGRILLLTATPIKNDLNELLELMNIIDPKYNETDFRKELNLTNQDEFDLTTVLDKERGVNRWWEWFSRFGERHTRITTMYDENKRKYGVHWKIKNSHSYYFNSDTKMPCRPYFDDYVYDSVNNTKIKVSNTKIKRVDGNIIDRENMLSVLQGERTSEIIHYFDNIDTFGPEDMDKFNRILRIIAYIKHDISLEELEQCEFNEKIDGITGDWLKNLFDKPEFKEWHSHSERYSSLGNGKSDIEKKKIIEMAVTKFLENISCSINGNNTKFFDDFFNYINRKMPQLQKDKNGISKIKNYSKLAIILCSDNIFLQLEKMLELGKIINDPKHANEKIIIFCKDDAERRMLVENAHLWDYTNRYMENEAVAKIGSLSIYDINYSKFVNVVSIAYTTDAEGLNLQSYHTMINYSIVMSPLHMEQRIGRIDRIGQKNDMDIYFLANAQDVEGYVLRFFEYELELFSNWSGDTTASTYVDAKDNGKNVQVEFDMHAQRIWNNILTKSMSWESKIINFEENISRVFNNVRQRVIKIAKYSKDIDDMKNQVESITNADMEKWY